MHALGISPYYLNINAFICIGATAFICPTEHGIIKSHIHTTNYSVSNDLCCLFTIVLCYTAVWYNTKYICSFPICALYRSIQYIWIGFRIVWLEKCHRISISSFFHHFFFFGWGTFQEIRHCISTSFFYGKSFEMKHKLNSFLYKNQTKNHKMAMIIFK